MDTVIPTMSMLTDSTSTVTQTLPMHQSLIHQTSALLHLLQLASPALPVGAYSYSDGLETLVHWGKINSQSSLKHWLVHELRYGAIRLEAAVMVRAHQAVKTGDRTSLQQWNTWLSASRETEELRQQSWQMGRALIRLLVDLQPDVKPLADDCGDPCNFAIAFSLAAAHWQIDCEATLLGYLHSWATNLVNAGIKLIPLGQTMGQGLLLDLYPELQQTVMEILAMNHDDLTSCGWGLALASMEHETLYSRLFRS